MPDGSSTASNFTHRRPGHGQPDNSSDPYFMQIRDDLADKGFFTATAEELSRGRERDR